MKRFGVGWTLVFLMTVILDGGNVRPGLALPTDACLLIEISGASGRSVCDNSWLASWTWTAPSTGPVTFDTEGSDFDMLLAGSDLDGIFQGEVRFSAQQGQKYSIFAWRTNDSIDPGTIALNWRPSSSGGGSRASFGLGGVGDQAFTVGRVIDPLTLPAATSGDAPLTYSLMPVPDGLSFDAATRTLTGTPTTEQSKITHTYTVADSDGDVATLELDITINAAPMLDPACENTEPCLLITVVDFSTHVKDDNPIYALDDERISEKLFGYVDRLKFEGTTSAYEALYKGTNRAVNVQLGSGQVQRRVVFFTDGLETSSLDVELMDIYDLQHEYEDELHTIVVGAKGRDITKTDQAFLHELCKYIGGCQVVNYYTAETDYGNVTLLRGVEQLGAEFREIATDVISESTSNVVAVSTPVNSPMYLLWTLDIIDDGGVEAAGPGHIYILAEYDRETKTLIDSTVEVSSRWGAVKDMSWRRVSNSDEINSNRQVVFEFQFILPSFIKLADPEAPPRLQTTDHIPNLLYDRYDIRQLFVRSNEESKIATERLEGNYNSSTVTISIPINSPRYLLLTLDGGTPNNTRFYSMYDRELKMQIRTESSARISGVRRNVSVRWSRISSSDDMNRNSFEVSVTLYSNKSYNIKPVLWTTDRLLPTIYRDLISSSQWQRDTEPQSRIIAEPKVDFHNTIVVVVIDRSGSLKDEAGQVKDAVKTLVNEMQMRFEEILDRLNSDP